MSYPALRKNVASAGLLDRSLWNYRYLLLVTAALAAISAYILLYAEGLWILLAVPTLSLFWMQVGFFGHDAGHNQVFENTKLNRFFGYLCFPVMLGMSFRPWVIRHNLHHAETNVEGTDPDLENKVIAYTEDVARTKRGFARWLVRWQAYLFPLLAMLATVGFRMDAWSYVSGKGERLYSTTRYERERRWELVMLTTHAVLWVVVPSIVLGPLRWLPVLVLGQMLFGLHMASVFAPNHKGMPLFDEKVMPSFLEAQVLTSRNVISQNPILCAITDWMYGGLNYQIEHHLFPTMARSKLAAARKMVREHCASIGLPHTEESVIESWKSIFHNLDEVGRSVIVPNRQVAAPTA